MKMHELRWNEFERNIAELLVSHFAYRQKRNLHVLASNGARHAHQSEAVVKRSKSLSQTTGFTYCIRSLIRILGQSFLGSYLGVLEQLPCRTVFSQLR